MYDIIIKDLKIFAFHGVNEEEKINGQDFIIDAIVKVNNDLESLDDNIENTISYSKLIRLINSVMISKSYDLIESVAYAIEQEIFNKYDSVNEIELTIKKPRAPIKADFDYVAVRIKNVRSDINV